MDMQIVPNFIVSQEAQCIALDFFFLNTVFTDQITYWHHMHKDTQTA